MISQTLSAVQNFLKSTLFEFFKEPNVAISLALALLVAGLIFVLWIVLGKWLPTSRVLRQLERTIRKTSGEVDFKQSFNAVDEAMTAYKFVSHGWAEFKETLILPAEESHEPIKNTARPTNYINISEAETSGLHLKFWQAVPNYFVGLGLLFTFLGLVAAIYFAAEGINAEADIARTQESLRNLLNAATFKFLTSIAGITSSLIVAMTYRLAASRLQTRFNGLCEALEERLAFITPESIAYDQFTELQKQSEQLERFNTDFAFSVAKELETRLNQSLPENLEKALAPMAATMSSMADRFGEMNQDAMSSMLERFTERLQEGAGAEMRELGSSLTETKESLGSLAHTLQAAGGQLTQTLSAAGHHLEAAASTMEQSFKDGVSSSTEELQGKMSQISTGFSQQFESSAGSFTEAVRSVSRDASELLKPMQAHMQKLTTQMDGLSGGLANQIENIGHLNGQLNTLVQNTQAASAQLQSAGEPVKQASDAISNAAVQIAETSKVSAGAHRELTQFAASLRESVSETATHWREYQERFEQVDKDLANTFAQLSDGTAQQHSVIREFVSGVDREFDKALRSLAAGVDGLQENLEEFTAAVESLGTRLNDATAHA